MSPRTSFTRTAAGLRPVAAAVLLTVGAALGALGTLAATGQVGLARASSQDSVRTSSMPAPGVVPPAAVQGFDGIDHSLPPARDALGNAQDRDEEATPTF